MLPDLFTRAVRSKCSECGWGRLDWMSEDGARSEGLPVDEAVAFVGPVVSAWRCPSCGFYGFFGRTETG